MKKTSRLIFMLGIFVSCKTTSIHIYPDPKVYCNAYSITKMEYGKDDYFPGVNSDTISVLSITVEQENVKYTIDGPDYCMLFVVDQKNDTIGRTAINGLPTPDRPRTYQAFGDQKWKVKPDVSTLKVYIEYYCPDIPVKMNKQ